jgi:hypothetical protein
MARRIDISKSMVEIGLTRFRKWHKRKFADIDDMTSDERFVALGGKLPKKKEEKEGDE